MLAIVIFIREHGSLLQGRLYPNGLFWLKRTVNYCLILNQTAPSNKPAIFLFPFGPSAQINFINLSSSIVTIEKFSGNFVLHDITNW